MQKVSGIGGFFFRADNPTALAERYLKHQKHLGIDRVPGSYDIRPWRQEAGETVFAPYDKVTNHFGGREKPFMLNFRVPDLEAMIAQLEAAGTAVRRDPKDHPNGRFAWLDDPEGNPIELWEPS